MRLRLFAALALCVPLSGCFIFIPGPVIGAVSDAFTGDRGEHCVPRGTQVGQRINLGFNRVGVVEHVSSSASSRCRDPLMPLRAAIALPPGATMDQPGPAPAPASAPS